MSGQGSVVCGPRSGLSQGTREKTGARVTVSSLITPVAFCRQRVKTLHSDLQVPKRYRRGGIKSRLCNCSLCQFTLGIDNSAPGCSNCITEAREQVIFTDRDTDLRALILYFLQTHY